MIKKCIGCGITLQNIDPNSIGYIDSNTKLKLCKRCFRLKNYGEYLSLNSNDYYLDIKKLLKDKESIILHIVDIFNIPNEDLLGDRKKDSILVVNKRDILPKSNNENTLLLKIKNYYPGYMDYILLSSKNNHNMDNLYNLLLSKGKKNIYVIGYTNSGKSTLINKLIKNYSKLEENILTSYYPSTTLETMKIKLNENITLIDTPGIVRNGSIFKSIDLKDIKKITINKEIKPIILQFENKVIIKIDKYSDIECNCIGRNSIIIYGCESLVIEKKNQVNSFDNVYEFNADDYKEIVISDLCFFKLGKKASVFVHINKDIYVYERNKLT